MEIAAARDFLFRREVVLAYIVSQEPESDRHKRPQLLITGAVAKRGLDGEWAVIIKLDGDIDLKDGRILPIRREVHFNARQQGRKANPAQNWGKGGGFRKKAKE